MKYSALRPVVRSVIRNVGALCALILATGEPAHAQSSFMLVSSRNTHSVKMFDGETGEFVRDFVSAGSGGLNTTQDVVWSTDGHLLVTGRVTDDVLKFDGESGEFIGAFSSGYKLDNPTKMSFGPDGHLYVSQWGTDEGRSKVVRFDGESGVFIDEFTSDDPAQGCDHAWDDDGNMYLAAFASRNVVKYAPDGTLIGSFTDFSTLQGPVNVWFDPATGDLLVADWTSGRIDRFDPESGEFKRSLVGSGALENVEGFAYGPDGKLYAADWSRNTIKRFDPRLGEDEGVFASGGGLQAPNAILFGPPSESQPTSIEEAPEGHGFFFKPNYPEPFRSTTIIPFSAPQPSIITLKLFDISGRLVMTRSVDSSGAGSGGLTITGDKLRAGTYLYRIEVGGRTQSGVAVRVD